MMAPRSFETKILQRNLIRKFNHNSIRLGTEYFYNRAVNNIKIEDLSASAEVKGTELYFVQLDWQTAADNGLIKTECTCPHFTQGNFCKHLWALILELDRQGTSRNIPLRKHITLTFKNAEQLKTLQKTAAAPLNFIGGAQNPNYPALGILAPTHPLNGALNQSAYAPSQNPLTPSKTWQEIFDAVKPAKTPGQPNQKKYEDSPAASSYIFLTLEADHRNDQFIKLKFFTAEKINSNTSAAEKPDTNLSENEKIEISPLSLPTHGHIKTRNPHLATLFLNLATLAQSEIGHTFRYASYPVDLSCRIYRTKTIRPLINGLLATKRIYASTERVEKEYKEKSPQHLISANFGAIKIKVEESASHYSLSGAIQMKEIFIPINELKILSHPNLLSWQNYIGFNDLTEGDLNFLSQFEGPTKEPLLIPKTDAEAFLETILNQPQPVELPPSLKWEQVNSSPVPKLHLTVDRSSTDRSSTDRASTDRASLDQSMSLTNEPLQSARYLIDLKFQYDSRTISHLSTNKVLASAHVQKFFLRNFEEETRVYNLLPQHLIRTRSRESIELPSIAAKSLYEFVKTSLAAGIYTVVENKKVQETKDLQLSVTSGVDWFDVDGKVDFEGRWVKLPALLESITKGESFVPLDDGSIGVISEQMKDRLEKLANFSENTKTGLRFNKIQGLILNSMLESEQHVNLDATFEKLREQIKGFTGVTVSAPPKTFIGQLRKYQKEGLGWLKFLEAFGFGGILADDMGLGKTIQCLAFLEYRRLNITDATSSNKTNAPALSNGPSLLIAPKSLLNNWLEEAQKFTPELKAHIHAGFERKTNEEIFKKYDLVVTTYQTMLRDIDLLKNISWSCVILDEAQMIKNTSSLISKAAKLLPAQFRLAMTGTPIENSIQDLFSISNFVNPGFLNRKKNSAHLKLSDDLKSTLSKAFKPILLRRTKDQVLKDLPKKSEQLIHVELEETQLKAYNDLKKYYQSQLLSEVKTQGVNKSRIKVLAALTRLRQAALHPGLIDPAYLNAKSAKFEAALEMIEEIISEGHRILIFSQFTSLLTLLKTELNQRNIKFCYLDGKTTARAEVIVQFKTQNMPVFLMSLKAGGVGLNLVEADYVFLLDPWWNPAVESQAIDRAHRIGQKNVVHAYRFIAKNTVEEKILELQNTKKNIAAELFGEQSSLVKNLSSKDIENLFS